jgi:hypothetical protein
MVRAFYWNRNNDTCVNSLFALPCRCNPAQVVNKQPCSTFLDTPVFEHITTREAVMNGAPVALKDCLFYCTFADNDIDPHGVYISQERCCPCQSWLSALLGYEAETLPRES